MDNEQACQLVTAPRHNFEPIGHQNLVISVVTWTSLMQICIDTST